MRVITIIKRELNLGFRQSWTYSFLLLFTIFTVTILLLNKSVSSVAGYTDMTGTIMNMTLYLLPLITLLLGSFSLTSEKEDGHWGLLATYPLSSYVFLIGKWLGLVLILSTIIFFSFGISGILLGVFGQSIDKKTFVYLLVFSLLLAVTFLSLSFLIGTIAKNRWQALLWVIGLWFVTIIAWPLLIVSSLNYLPSYQMIQPTLQLLTFLNPAEFIRIFITMRLGAGSAFGADYDQWITWAIDSSGLFIFLLSISIFITLLLMISGWVWDRGDKYGDS